MQTILFVDDDADFLASTARLLHKQKDQWDLRLVSSTDAALEYLENNRVDLIVSDILMPGKSGLQLLTRIKENAKTKNIPVIMVSGMTDADLKLKALEQGALDLLTKPYDKAEIIARITNCLQLKRYHDQINIQNQRLEEELADRVRFEGLVSSITSALAAEDDLRHMLKECCQAIVNNLDAAFARVWVWDNKENRLELYASAGMYTHIEGEHQFIDLGQYKIGRIAKSKKPHLTNQVIGDPEINHQEWAKKEKMTGFAGHALIAEGRLVGVMGMFSRIELKTSALNSLAAVVDGIALGIAQKQMANRAHFYSFYDTLTLLPNRKFFFLFLGKMISYANRYQKDFALMLVDIDDFNRINDNLGHVVGDRCLKVISQRLSDTLRDSDCLARLSLDEFPIARLGGDEFAILLQNSSEFFEINSVIKRLLKDLARPIPVNDRNLILTISVGVAVYPGNADSIEELLKNAETALYHAKKKGKNDFVFYSYDMNHQSLENLDLEIDLRAAMDKDEFQLYFQPKISLKTNSIEGSEALIRWEKDGRMISPANFIPLAEDTGLILPIGDWVIQTACRQQVKWQDQGLKKLPVAVNVSGRQFGQKDFIRKVETFLRETGLSPAYLELEITETSLMMNPQVSVENLAELKKMGLTISLDDFGTGYSSLSYLQTFPVDQLKIDIAFIRNVMVEPKDAVMVKTIISMAHNLGLKVIAEGVEEPDQMKFLADHGCDMVQGYLFSPPVPASQFAEHVKKDVMYDFSEDQDK